MPKRYEKIEFKDFSDGEGFERREKENGFHKSSLISVDSLFGKYLRTGYKFNDLEFGAGLTFSVFWFPAIAPAGDNDGFEFFYDRSIRMPVVVDIGGGDESLRIYRVYIDSSGDIASTLIATITDKYDSDLIYYQVGNKFYLTYEDVVTGTQELVSSNGGSTWGASSSAADGSQAILHDGSHYTRGGTIKKSLDEGASWVTVISPSDHPFTIGGLLFYRGFFYAKGQLRGEQSYLFLRFTEDLQNYEVLHEFQGRQPVQEIFDDKIFISNVYNGKIQIFTYDGGDVVNIFKEFPDYELTQGGLPLWACKIKIFDSKDIYFMPHNENFETYELIKYNKKGFFISNIAEVGTVFLDVRDLGGDVVVLSSENYTGEGSEPDLIIEHDNDKEFVALSSIDLSLIGVGTHKPVYVILRHDPLPAGVSIKVYKKVDKAAAWGAAILTSETDDDVLQLIKLTGDKVDFYQFKVELITSNSSNGAENVELTYLYLPLGLENSK